MRILQNNIKLESGNGLTHTQKYSIYRSQISIFSLCFHQEKIYLQIMLISGIIIEVKFKVGERAII